MSAPSKISAESLDYFRQEMRRLMPKQWFQYIEMERYEQDFGSIQSSRPDTDVDYLVRQYTGSASDCADAVYICSSASELATWSKEKRFMGLDRPTMELAFRNYLRLGFYSEPIELTVLMAFLGHEFEMFQYEMSKVHIGTLDRIFSTKRMRTAEKYYSGLDALRSLYQALLVPEVSTKLLGELIKPAVNFGIQIDPNVFTVLERAEENGVKRFRKG